MNVLHLSSAKSWRGGEQQIAYLIRALQKRKVRQWVFCPKNSPLHQYCIDQKIDCYTYRKLFSVNPYPAYRLRKIIALENIQVVHLHDSHAHTFACIGAHFFGISTPMVLSRRVIVPIQKNALSLWKYRHPAIQRIICVSHFVKKVLEADLGQSNRIKVVYSGIDPQKFASTKKNKSLRTEFQIPDHCRIIANVAAIEPFKDYFTFVDTAALLLQQKLNARFFIIGGDGGQEAAIKTYIQQKGLQEHFILTGFRNDIPQILPSIDLLLFSSQTEGLGTSILDAFACSVPVVATNAGGIPEVVIHEKTGLLAKVGDAVGLAQQVTRLLDDPTLEKQLVEGAKRHLEQFSQEQMGAGTFEVYQELGGRRT